MLCNRAAARLSLESREDAAADCRAALKLSPLNAKAHWRLAKALEPEDPEAAQAMLCAVALLPRPLDADARALFERIRAACTQLALPADASRVVAASSLQQLVSALHNSGRHGLVLVLHPGTYELPPGFPTYSYTLVGAGEGVVLSCRTNHVVAVLQTAQRVQLVNVRLRGGDKVAAAACAAAGAKLVLFGCSVVDNPEGGLLVCFGGAATLLRCAFTRCALHAVEVREGGSLEANDVRIEACSQGISVYGGAQSVVLRGCTITQCKKEGIMAAGTFTNAATMMQEEAHKSKTPTHELPPQRNAETTAAAQAWGRARKLQTSLELVDCVLSSNGCFGISADLGVRVLLERCVLQDNDPFAVFVKGGCDVAVRACAFSFAAASSSKSFWSQRHSRRSFPLTGVHVAVNYGGEVEVHGCAFAAPERLCVIEQMSASRQGGRSAEDASLPSPQEMRTMGMWSRPVSAKGNAHLPPGAPLPPVAQLAAQLARAAQPAAQTTPPPAAAAAQPAKRGDGSRRAAPLCAITRTFSTSIWDPTGNSYYAIGNTHGFDVCGGHTPAAQQQPCEILLAGCGDVRNLLATAAGWRARAGAPPAGAGLRFTLCDGSVSVLARDAVLLRLCLGAPEHVLAVWADHALCEGAAAALRAACEELAAEPWPPWLAASASLDGGGGGGAEAAVRAACRAWCVAVTFLVPAFAHFAHMSQGAMPHPAG